MTSQYGSSWQWFFKYCLLITAIFLFTSFKSGQGWFIWCDNSKVGLLKGLGLSEEKIRCRDSARSQCFRIVFQWWAPATCWSFVSWTGTREQWCMIWTGGLPLRPPRYLIFCRFIHCQSIIETIWMVSKWQENNSEIIWVLASFPLFTWTWHWQDPNVVGESQVDLQVDAGQMCCM